MPWDPQHLPPAPGDVLCLCFTQQRLWSDREHAAPGRLWRQPSSCRDRLPPSRGKPGPGAALSSALKGFAESLGHFPVSSQRAWLPSPALRPALQGQQHREANAAFTREGTGLSSMCSGRLTAELEKKTWFPSLCWPFSPLPGQHCHSYRHKKQMTRSVQTDQNIK